MSRSKQRKEAVFLGYKSETTGKPLTTLMLQNESDANPVGDFTIELAKGVGEHTPELDAEITKRSKQWSLERIAPLEKSILRVALFEIFYRDDVPNEVAVNEAIEITKKYCEGGAPGFVNGILGSTLEEIKSGTS